MKTAGRENPNHGGALPRNRAHGAVGQNSSPSITWAGKQEKLRPPEKCFSLTSPFIELIRPYPNVRYGVQCDTECSAIRSAVRYGVQCDTECSAIRITSRLSTARPRRVGRERHFYERRISLLCPDRSRWSKGGAVFCAPRAGFVSYSCSDARFPAYRSGAVEGSQKMPDNGGIRTCGHC